MGVYKPSGPFPTFVLDEGNVKNVSVLIDREALIMLIVYGTCTRTIGSLCTTYYLHTVTVTT
jgi:hypothetical protein